MKKKTLLKIFIIVLVVIFLFYILKLYASKKSEDTKKEYQIAEVSSYKYFVIKEDDRFGVIDDKGNKIIEAKYDDVKIPNPEQAVFVCYQDSNTKVFNDKNQEILTEFNKVEPLELKDVSSDLMYEKSVLKYFDNGKYGIIDFSGKKLTKAIYDDIDTLQAKEGNLLVKIDNKCGIININGAEIIDVAYDKIEADKYYDENDRYKYEGYITCNVSDEGYRYGYINYEGKKITDPVYNELYRIPGIGQKDAYLICAENGKYGLLENSEKKIDNDYQSLSYNDSNNTIIAQKGKKYGVFSISGNMIVPVEYKQIDVSGDYLYATSTDGTIKVFDDEGKEADIDSSLKIINTANENDKIYIDSSEGKTIYSVYKNGTKVTKKDYLYIQYLYDNYFIACENYGKLGVIDDDGNVKIDLKYSSIQKIDNTKLIQAQSNTEKTLAIYSSNMDKVAELKNASFVVMDNYIKLFNDDDIKYVSFDGRELSNTELFSKNKIFAKKSGDKWGFVDSNGNVVVDYKYDKVTEINEYGFAGIEVDEKWGVIDDSGKVIVEPQYEIDSNSPEFIGEYYKLVYGNGEIYYTK